MLETPHTGPCPERSRLLRGGRRRFDFQFRDQKQLDNAEGIIGVMYNDRSPARGLREKFAVRNMVEPPVSQANGKRPKGPRLVNVAKLLNGHSCVSLVC